MSSKHTNTVLWCFILLWPQNTAQFVKKTGKSNITHSLRITNIQCVETPYELTYLNYCKMEQLPNNMVALNVSILAPMVLNFIETKIKLFYKYTSYRPFMIDWSIELCQAYRMGRFNPSAILMLKVIEDTAPQYHHPCPHGNRTYIIVWLFNPKFIPETLPSGNYRLDIYLRDTTNKILFAFQMFGAIRKHGLIG
ncbi:uncharacterized protein LOC128717809 [Anopheles marshallii]|uniref:uncharacterized protein LOC128717809 n=1 Tax=Anopheles marshallii TaxID=1521116 RepID=UPI00237AAB75|nr:uncharacterized protein LOC128717809 [Anopheles marshallii]